MKEMITRIDRLDAEGRVNKEKARKYDEMLALLKNVRVRVDRATPVLSMDNDEYYVQIAYKIGDECIAIENGEAALNETVRALNLLGIVSVDDMNKIINAIEIAVRLNNGQ